MDIGVKDLNHELLKLHEEIFPFGDLYHHDLNSG